MELQLFKQIWRTRPHVSQISGKPLLYPTHSLWHWQFAHVLAKGTFGKFRTYEKNIVLMLPEEHSLLDSGSTINLPEYRWVHELKEELKREYYQN